MGDLLRSPVGGALAASGVGVACVAWLGLPALPDGGTQLAIDFLAAAVRPTWHDPVTGTSLPGLALRSAGATLAYGVASTGLAIGGGLPLGILIHRRGPASRSIRWLAGGLASTARALNGPLWAIVFLATVGLSPTAGVLAIALPGLGSYARAVADLLEEAPEQAARAVREQGGGPVASLLLGALPTRSGELVSVAMVRLECAVRTAAVLGFFGLPTLGVHIGASVSSLDFAGAWTFLYALLGTGLALELISHRVRAWIRPAPRGRRLGLVGIGAAACALWVWSLPVLSSTPTGGLPWTARLASFLSVAVAPGGLGVFVEASTWRVWLDTIALAGASTAIAGSAGGALAPLVAGRGGAVLRIPLLIARAIPEYVWAFLAVTLWGLGPAPAVLALALHNTGVLGRLGAELIQDEDPGPTRAVREQGGGRLARLVWGTWPQIRGRYLLYVALRAEACLREASVLGLTGVISLGWLVTEHRAAGRYDRMVAVLVLTCATFVAAGVGTTWLRDRLRGSGLGG